MRFLVLVTLLCVLLPDVRAGAAPNVLFICVDDLRPALGCYGVRQAQTPHMDRLARTGRLFLNHYVQVPTCGASRYAMLTGTLPRDRAALSNGAASKLAAGESESARTMPELFRKNGYTTVCIGKISHMPDGKVFKYDGTGDGRPELPGAWDEFLTPYGAWGYGHGAFFGYGGGVHREDKSGYRPYSEFPDVADSELPDGMMADEAIGRLDAFAKSGKPFFMGLGFYKPHLPFVAPLKYRAMYDDVEWPSATGLAKGDTSYSHGSGEFYKYTTNRAFGRPAKGRNLSESNALEVRRAYLACVSYVDAQVGRVLDALETSGLAKNTIVVLWGDHGWHLGENNIWGKHAPLEKALRSALMLRLPDQQKAGAVTTSLAASVDLYPTLIDLCDLKNSKTLKALDGVSLRPVLEDPQTQVRDGVPGFWRNSKTLVSDDHRLIVSQARNGKPVYELYDHRSDPGELKNIAAQFPERVSQLHQRLKSELAESPRAAPARGLMVE